MTPGRPGRFAILSRPRCGSTLLVMLLDSHPRVTCFGELFNPNHIRWRRNVGDLPYLKPFRNRFPRLFLAAVLGARRPSHALGFKMHPRQCPSLRDRLIRRKGVRKILIYRENMLATFSSEMIAFKTLQWGLWPGEARRYERVVFDPMAFAGWVERRRSELARERALLAETGAPAFEIEYRDLDNPETLRALLAFLGVEERPLTADTRIQNPDRLEDRFVNWADVRRYMTLIGREDWLESDRRRPAGSASVPSGQVFDGEALAALAARQER